MPIPVQRIRLLLVLIAFAVALPVFLSPVKEDEEWLVRSARANEEPSPVENASSEEDAAPGEDSAVEEDTVAGEEEESAEGEDNAAEAEEEANAGNKEETAALPPGGTILLSMNMPAFLAGELAGAEGKGHSSPEERLFSLLQTKLEDQGYAVRQKSAAPTGEQPGAGKSPAVPGGAPHPSLTQATDLPLVGVSDRAVPLYTASSDKKVTEYSIAPERGEKAFSGIPPASGLTPAQPEAQPENGSSQKSRAAKQKTPGRASQNGTTQDESPAAGALDGATKTDAPAGQTGGNGMEKTADETAGRGTTTAPKAATLSVAVERLEDTGWNSTTVAGRERLHTRLTLHGTVTLTDNSGVRLLRTGIAGHGKVNASAGSADNLHALRPKAVEAALATFAEQTAEAVAAYVRQEAGGGSGAGESTGKGDAGKAASPKAPTKHEQDDRARYQDSPGKRLKPKK